MRPTNRKEAWALLKKAQAELSRAGSYDETKAAERHVTSAKKNFERMHQSWRRRLCYCLEMDSMTDEHVMNLLDATRDEMKMAKEYVAARRGLSDGSEKVETARTD